MSRYGYELLCAFLLLILCNSAYSQAAQDDWKFYGGTKIGKEVLITYFSLSSVENMQNGHVRVWIKSLPAKEIQKILDATNDKSTLMTGASKKIASGYIPPCYVINEYTQDELIGLVLNEEVVNHSNISYRARIFYELDCAEKRYKHLSLSFVDKAGKSSDASGEDNWKYIPPDSNANTLIKLLCKKQSN
jgi:hypothetical protein